jgi:hypothetical protein
MFACALLAGMATQGGIAAAAPAPLDQAGSVATAEVRRPSTPTLVGLNVADLLDGDGRIGGPAGLNSDRPATAPAASTVAATTDSHPVPFPSAAHLFIPGAALALYATRRMKPRYRRG